MNARAGGREEDRLELAAAGAGHVQITLVEDFDTLWPRRKEWNDLVERSATNTVFQTLEWHRSWWRAFGSEAQSLVLLAEVAGKIVGIAPLMLSVQRILGRKRRVVEFIGTHAADYSDFIVEPAQRKAVSLMLEWLIDRPDRWDLLHLVNIAEASPLREVLPQMFRQRGYAAELRRLYECPSRVFGDPDADYRVTRKKSLRATHNQLARQGLVEFKVHFTAADIEDRLAPFFQQHIDRWANTSTPSFFGDERQRSFYRELARLLAPNGWLLFSVLSVNRVPISFHFGFLYGERLYVIKPTFDPGYGRYAPGMLQIKYLLEYALALGAKELDFTTGEEAYKYRFANHARTNYAARVHRHSMFYGIDRVLLYAKATAKRSALLTRMARYAKPWLARTLYRLGL